MEKFVLIPERDFERIEEHIHACFMLTKKDDILESIKSAARLLEIDCDL